MRLPTASRPVSAETSSSNSLARPPSLTLNLGPTTLSLMVSGLPHPSVLLPCSTCAVPVGYSGHMQRFPQHELFVIFICCIQNYVSDLLQQIWSVTCQWHLLHSDKRLHLVYKAFWFCSENRMNRSDITRKALFTPECSLTHWGLALVTFFLLFTVWVLYRLKNIFLSSLCSL